MIDIKTPERIAIMAEGGKKIGNILKDLLEMAQPDVSLLKIEKAAVEKIAAAGGSPSFQTVEDYKWATCLCVNDVVVHGIPTDYVLQTGDVLTIDIGMLYKGLHTDTAWTKVVGPSWYKASNDVLTFLKQGQEALKQSIAVAVIGNHVGHISQMEQRIIEGAGYSIIKSLVGHGVGLELHEDPQVPGYVRGRIEKTPLLEEGMTIAIEVIYALGKGEIEYSNGDGWTLATQDGSLTAVFEHTIAITADGPKILTGFDH